MPKKFDAIDYVKYTTADILEMSPEEISALNRSDLAKITSTLARVANKRVQRIRSNPRIKNPETILRMNFNKEADFDNQIKKFSVKGKNVNQLRRTLENLRSFLTRKTSTIKGAVAFEKALGIDDLPEGFWDSYSRWKERHPSSFISPRQSYKEAVLDAVSRGASIDTATKHAQESVTQDDSVLLTFDRWLDEELEDY